MSNVFPTRAASVADAAALVALVNSAYRGESSRAGWTTEADLLGGQRVDLEAMSESLGRDQSSSVILVHEHEDAIMVCVQLERTGDECYLGMLTVRPRSQGAGLGRQMLEAAENWAREQWSARRMHMTVIVQRTELIEWYQRRGYLRSGERKPFPYGQERFGLPRREDLEFEVLHKALAAEPE